MEDKLLDPVTGGVKQDVLKTKKRPSPVSHTEETQPADKHEFTGLNYLLQVQLATSN